MPDLSMCVKKDCPSFGKCYRAQAKPSDIVQVYQNFDNGKKDKCKKFIKIAVEGACKP